VDSIGSTDQKFVIDYSIDIGIKIDRKSSC